MKTSVSTTQAAITLPNLTPLSRLLVRTICAMLVSIALLAEAAPGDLDSTFAGQGKFMFGFGSQNATGRGVAVQSDGKMVVTANGTGLFTVLRYNPDGSRDPSFGGSGEVTLPVIPVNPPTAQAAAFGVALQADGKILVTGTIQSQNPIAVDFITMRYNSDGTLDNSFGNGGTVVTDFESRYDLAYTVKVQSDGKIVVAGSSGNSSNEVYFSVARYHSDGSPDGSFNGTGKATVFIATRGAGGAVPADMTLQADGKIIVAGSIPGNAAANGFWVARFTGEGTPDSTFGLNGNGLVKTVVSARDEVCSVAIQAGFNTVNSPDKIVVAGTSVSGTTDLFTAVRYNLNGVPDNSFDNDGIVTTDITNTVGAKVRAMGVEQKGFLTRKIVLAGYVGRTLNGKYFSELVVVRYNIDGKPDTTFDTDGIVTAMVGRSTEANGLTFASGKIIIAGQSVQPLLPDLNYDLALLRLNSTDGSLDFSLDGDGTKADDIGGSSFTLRGITIGPDGKIVLCGSFLQTGGVGRNGTALARLNPDGTLDNSFDEDGKLTLSRFEDEASNAVALQPDGKIVVAGAKYDGAQSFELAVARYNSNGTRDASFDGGLVTESLSNGETVAQAVAVQPDGKIVVAGYGTANKRDSAILRFEDDGDLDDSFGADGSGAVFASLGIGDDEVRALALQPDGKIVVAGVAEGVNGKRFFAARITDTGLFDQSFNNGEGVIYIRFPSGDAEATSLALDAQGRIIIAGFVSNGVNYDFAVARLTSNGLIDSTFNNGGLVTTPISAGDDMARGIGVQSDGKIVVAGGAFPNSMHGMLMGPGDVRGDYALVRYLPNGLLDNSYGNLGKVLVGFGSDLDQSAYGVALDAQSRAVVVGKVEIFAFFAGVMRIEPGPLGTTPLPTPTPTPSPTPPTTLANISTRLQVETGDNVLIGGFIVTGTQDKKVIIRAIGPSLPFGGRLENPTLELRDSAGTLLDSNDDWVNSPNKQAILDSTIPPSNDFESAIVATLPANGAAYTAIVRGANDGTGIGVVEAYDLDRSVDSKLANISTRGFVATGDNVLIAGTIVLGSQAQKVIVRAIGPSLPVAGKLENPTLELRDGNGGLLEANDDWVSSPNKQAIIDSTIPPANDFESAIVHTLAPAAYTAIVRGVNDTTGIAVVEVYALP